MVSLFSFRVKSSNDLTPIVTSAFSQSEIEMSAVIYLISPLNIQLYNRD